MTFVVLTLAVGADDAGVTAGHASARMDPRSLAHSTSLTAGILSYRRLVQMLAAYDLKRNPAETQSEFARGRTSFWPAAGRPLNSSPMCRSRSSTRFIATDSGTWSSIRLRSKSSMRGSTPWKPA